MENFVYHNPTKVIFGGNTLDHIGPETALHGNRVLLVSGKNSAKAHGIYSKVIDSLAQAGLEVIEHEGVQPNPVLRHVHKGIELAKRTGCDVVCGVGGGSVLDEAKAIGAGALVEHDVWKFFTGKKSVKNTLPLTCVVTLAASGSEMNSGMVLTKEATKQKFGFANRHLFPKTSILDPQLTYTVSSEYTSYGAVDAIAHLLEMYFTTKVASPVQDRFIEGLVINIMESCNLAIADPYNYQARSQLMWAASLALCGLMSSGLGKIGFPMHLLEHSLSGVYNTPHGAGLAAIIPGWMRYQSTIVPQKFAQFSSRVFGVREGSIQVKASHGIARLEGWFRSNGCPVTLQELQVPSQDIPNLAENALALSRVWRMREYSQEVMEEILGYCN